jgi:protein-S-isoprenylcysteine O-methyltransferase Ste14
MPRRLYIAFAYVGLLSVPAAYITGWRHDPAAPSANLWFDLALFAVFIGVHFVMTTAWFKRTFFGRPEGTPQERRVYIAVSIITWIGMYLLHEPVAGPGIVAPDWLRFVGLCCVLLGVVAFFEFATIEGLGSLLGVPGMELSHSTEAPLMTEGPYASVRHPMYRAATLYMLASLLIHPNASQLLFSVLGALGFLAFIPVEEAKLLRTRGDAYRGYMQVTRWRVFRGLW